MNIVSSIKSTALAAAVSLMVTVVGAPAQSTEAAVLASELAAPLGIQVFERRGRGTDSISDDSNTRVESGGSNPSGATTGGGGSGEKTTGDERKPRPKSGDDKQIGR